jgi:hypothetical protein
MKNVEMKVEGSKGKEKLVITVDLSQRHGLSSSGKTVTIASTEGNQRIGHGDVAFGLSVYTKEGLDKLKAEAAKLAEAG